MSLADEIRRRKVEKQSEKTLHGRVISSYYGAEDLELLQTISQKEGIALGGLQHEATLRFLESLKADIAEKATEKSFEVLKEISQGLKEKHSDPQGVFGQ